MNSGNAVLFPSSPSIATSQTSVIIPMTWKLGALVTCTLSGSPNGTIKLQVTADEIPTPGGNWMDVPSSSQTVSTSGIYGWNVDKQYCTGMIVVYTAISGSGTITGQANTKGFK